MADKGKNFFDRAREIDEKAKAMEEEEERLAAEEDKKERAEYEKQLQNEKVELMKLKAGVISDFKSLPQTRMMNISFAEKTAYIENLDGSIETYVVEKVIKNT